MMLLELNEPNVALQRFDNLIECRKDAGGGTALARAYRLQAIANERQVPPKNRLAYDALLRAVAELSPGCTLDHAITYEHLAMVAGKRSFTAIYAQNLQRAWSYYHALRSSAEGKSGLDRVSAKLAQLNASTGDADSNISTNSLQASESNMSPAVRLIGWLSKLTKPNG